MAQLVVFDISLSQDGYIQGPRAHSGNPLGEGGGALHIWAGADATEAERALMDQYLSSGGAVICGRRTYDDSLPGWGADGPTGQLRLPTIVLTHTAPAEVPDGGVYRFAHDLKTALHAARTASGGKDICVMGGADTGRQFLRAGLIDELSLHIAPVLLGGGKRMFEEGVRRDLRIKSIVQSPHAVHVRYIVDRKEQTR